MDTLGIWIFMLIMVMPIPFFVTGFGKYMMGSGAEEVSEWIGYRTPFSKKNRETWAFSQRYYGKLLYKPGMLLLVCSIVGMILVFGEKISMIVTVSCVFEGVQLFYIILAIIPTERALHSNFDKNGNRLN